MKDYKLTVKVRNNRILKAIEEVGGTQGGKWCQENGLEYVSVNNLINMTCSPLSASGALSKTAARLCEVLIKSPDDLWSNEQIYPLEKNFSEMEMDYHQIMALMPPDQQCYLSDFSGIEQEQTTKLVASVVSKLTKREQQVVRMRYYENKTLEECAKELDISSARVMQIESRALKKMRHPSLGDILRNGAID